jgi:hypothetical protein
MKAKILHQNIGRSRVIKENLNVVTKLAPEMLMQT